MRTAGVLFHVEHLDRYHRQVLLPAVGPAGQRRLLESHAVIVGLGALGCVSADLLARAGVGTLTLIDRDVVEASNLQRQSLYDERDAAEGLPKAHAARRRLAAVNSRIRLHALAADLNPRNAERLILGEPDAHPAIGGVGAGEAREHRGSAGGLGAGERGAGRPGVIVDGTDNFEARFLLNDVAVKHGIPFVYGGAVGTSGMQFTVFPGRGACLRCLFDGPPAPGSAPTCDTAGVLGPVAAIVGAVQAAEAIKVLLGRADRLAGGLLEFDAWENRRRRLDLSRARRADCPCCAERRFEFLGDGDGAERSTAVAALCGQDAVQVLPADGASDVDLARLGERLGAHGEVVVTEFFVRGRLAREAGAGERGIELTVFPDGRAVVRGTRDPARARGVYARYVGS